MMVNILLFSFLQWAFVITLPENQKTNCDKNKISCNSIAVARCNWTWGIWQSIEVLACKYDPKMSPQNMQQWKKGLLLVYSFFHVFMIPYVVVRLFRLLKKSKKQQSSSKRWKRWYNLRLLQCFQRWGFA